MATSSLPALTWRMSKAFNVGAGSAGAVGWELQAIADALAATVWASGDARSAGSGNAWSIESQVGSDDTTEALVLKPPTGSPAANLRVVLAGYPSSKTPTMLAPDTFVADMILAGYSKDAGDGTFTTWDAATPFGAQHFSGYYRGMMAANYDYFRVYESKEALVIAGTVGGNRETCAIIIGAIYEPPSTGSSDAESDDRVYGMVVSGSIDEISSTADTVSGRFMDHSASAGRYHNTFTDPGLTTQNTAMRYNYLTGATAASFLSDGGAAGSVPIYFGKGTAFGGRYLGRLREIEYFNRCRHGMELRDAGIVQGSVLGWDDDDDGGPSYILRY